MTANPSISLQKIEEVRKASRSIGDRLPPELVSDLRLCACAEVLVVGIPLDANSCALWWGEFQPETVNCYNWRSCLAKGAEKSLQ